MTDDDKGLGQPFDGDEKVHDNYILLKAFAELLNRYVKEIGLNQEGNIASHKIKGTISLRCLNGPDDKSYRIVGLDIGQLPGCGCWDGVVIEIEEYDD